MCSISNGEFCHCLLLFVIFNLFISAVCCRVFCYDAIKTRSPTLSSIVYHSRPSHLALRTGLGLQSLQTTCGASTVNCCQPLSRREDVCASTAVNRCHSERTSGASTAVSRCHCDRASGVSTAASCDTRVDFPNYATTT